MDLNFLFLLLGWRPQNGYLFLFGDLCLFHVNICFFSAHVELVVNIPQFNYIVNQTLRQHFGDGVGERSLLNRGLPVQGVP